MPLIPGRGKGISEFKASLFSIMSCRTHTRTYNKTLVWKKTRQTDGIWVNHWLTGLESHWKLWSRLRRFVSFWTWSLEIRLWCSPSQPSSNPFLTSLPSACPLHLLHLICIVKDTGFHFLRHDPKLCSAILQSYDYIYKWDSKIYNYCVHEKEINF